MNNLNDSRPASAGAVTKDDWLNLNGSVDNSETKSNKEGNFDAQNVAHNDLPVAKTAEENFVEFDEVTNANDGYLEEAPAKNDNLGDDVCGNSPHRVEDEDEGLCPTLSQETIHRLPSILRVMPRRYARNEQEETMMLLAQMAVAGAMMPNVVTIVNGREVHPSLMLLISGQPASGKGKAGLAKKLALRLNSKLMEDYANGNAVGAAESIFLPGNSSNSKFLELMQHNKGRALIFETEAKALINMLENKDYGLGRESLLAAGEHEPLEMARVTDNRRFRITNPELSIVATCVPSDIDTFLGKDGIQSGLLSRCLFFNLAPKKKEWNCFSNEEDEVPAEVVLTGTISCMESIYSSLIEREDQLKVKLSADQKMEIDGWLGDLFTEGELAAILGDEFDSVLKRMRTHTIRLCQILAVIRYAQHFGKVYAAEKELLISTDDFMSAMEIAKMLLEHSKAVFARLKDKNSTAKEAQKQANIHAVEKALGITQRKRLLLALAAIGETFTYKEFKQAAIRVGYANSKIINKVWHKMLASSEIYETEDGGYALSKAKNAGIVLLAYSTTRVDDDFIDDEYFYEKYKAKDKNLRGQA